MSSIRRNKSSYGGGTPPPLTRSQQAFRAAEASITKGGRPAVLSPAEWLERRAATRVAGAVSPGACTCVKSGGSAAEAAASVRVSLEEASRDATVSPIYPRVFSLASREGKNVAVDTLSTNFPDDVSAALLQDLRLWPAHTDLRAHFQGTLGVLADQVRSWFVWHYFGATHSIMWGAPHSEKTPMAPVGEWFDDSEERAPASARLKTPVTADVTPCPECVGCAARYGGCFDLYMFIHGVRRFSRCEHAGGPVPALEVTFLDGARARAAVAEGRMSAEDLTALVTYCDALAGLEANLSGIRMELAVETARGCCVNTHYKDSAASISIIAGVLHALSHNLVPSRAQAAIIAGAPMAELGLVKPALLPLDFDILSWAAQDVRDAPGSLLPTSSALAAAFAPTPEMLLYRAPHLAVCMRAATETLVTARLLERLRRSELTFRMGELLGGRYSEAAPRLRAPDLHAPSRLAPALMRDHLLSLLATSRDHQAVGEAILDAPPREYFPAGQGWRAISATQPPPQRAASFATLTSHAPSHAAWEGALNLAAVTGFAAAAATVCGSPTLPHVLLWMPPPAPKRNKDAPGVEFLPCVFNPVNNQLIPEGACAVFAAPDSCRGDELTRAFPPPAGDVYFTRAVTALPTSPAVPWVSVLFAWWRGLLQSAGFCDVVRRSATQRDVDSLKAVIDLVDVTPKKKCSVAGCGTDAVATCGACSIAHYCSLTCQERDWAAHKAVCEKKALASAGKSK